MRKLTEVNISMLARYDCRTGKKEELLEHLKSVGEKANEIAQCLREVLNDMHTEAYYAGIFHDLFKIVYQPDNIDEYCKNHDRLSFPYHEILSAVFFSNYALRTENINLSEDQIRKVAKAILLHHQGLRAITLENFFEGYNLIIKRAKARKDLNKLVNDVLKSLRLGEVVDVYGFLDFRTLEGLLDRSSEEDRYLSGILMIADNFSVEKNLNEKSKRLLEMEILDYLKAINCVD